MYRPLIASCLLALLVVACRPSQPTPASGPTATAAPTAIAQSCPMTYPNGSTPPDQPLGDAYYGNGALWTWALGTVVLSEDTKRDGVKLGWWRAVNGPLTIQGRRLDGPAPPLSAHIPSGYGNTGFQSTAIHFPTEGCWEITGSANNASLTVVVRVLNNPGG